MEKKKSVLLSRKRLLEIYGKNAYKIITKKGHDSLKKKYGKDWRKIISKKGLKVLKSKYGKRWYDFTLSKGRNKLKKKYGIYWQKELSKLAMKALRRKYGKNFERRPSNLKTLFKNRKLTKSESLIVAYLKKENIPFKTNVIKNDLEFDIVIPNENHPKYVIEVSDIKPTTYNQRMKILKLYYQKINFPSAQHIAILKTHSISNNENYRLQKITKSFLDQEGILILSLENIRNYISKLVEFIKNNEKIILNEDFIFNKRSIVHSKIGAIVQSKKITYNELKLNKLLTSINALPQGPQILEVKDNHFICVDNFEIYKNNKIAYEITSSNSNNSLRSLAGKILI